MKRFDRDIYRIHLKDIRNKSIDPFAIETYYRGVSDIANSFGTDEQQTGILDKNDIIQECFFVLAKTWNKMDFDKIKEDADNPQAYIWSYLKKTIKLQARDLIMDQKDGVRIPKNTRWELNETKNVDDFLTQLFPPEWFAANDEALGLYEEDAYLSRYDIEQLGFGLEDIMNKYLSSKEQLILEYKFGVDRDKTSSKEIAKILRITVSNVDKTKSVALQKLKNEDVRNYLQTFYHFE